MHKYLSLLRVHQWIKNIFVLAPLFFSGNFFEKNSWINATIIFFTFSLVASVIYIINDYRDIEEDKLHPTKKYRALAAGTVSKSTALIIAALLFTSTFSIAFILNIKLFYCLSVYLLLNISYSFGLKYISIVDIITVALGFVLRVFTGGFVLNIEVSQWLIIMTFLLALFIVIAKRRDDIYLEEKHGQVLRKSIAGYNEAFINICLSMLLAILIVSYLLYVTAIDTISRYSHKPIYISTIFVIVGVMRYLQITLVENKSGSPTKILLSDKFTQLNIIAWIIFFIYIIYF